MGIPSLGLFDTSNPVYDPAEEEYKKKMQKKKKRRGPKLSRVFLSTFQIEPTVFLH